MRAVYLRLTSIKLAGNTHRPLNMRNPGCAKSCREAATMHRTSFEQRNRASEVGAITFIALLATYWFRSMNEFRFGDGLVLERW